MRRAPTNVLAACLLFVAAGTALIVVPIAASARPNDRANAYVCKSGKKALDMKDCKENGGKK